MPRNVAGRMKELRQQMQINGTPKEDKSDTSGGWHVLYQHPKPTVTNIASYLRWLLASFAPYGSRSSCRPSL